MRLPVAPPLTPMLAELRPEIPRGDYQYEPKWDGFRALVFRDGDELSIQSRHERPLNRYFPELVQGLKKVLPRRIVLDGEIVIIGPKGLDFDALLLRLHPAASRVERLARETPAELVAFDVLALDARDLRNEPLETRRSVLERALVDVGAPVHLSPASDDVQVARAWFKRFEGAGLDGVVAKEKSLPYVAGERVLIKVKHSRTADCVVGGYRRHTGEQTPTSLLLGLYDAEDVLQFVGAASGFSAPMRARLSEVMKPYRRGAHTNHPWLAGDRSALRVPGGPSRWSGARDMSWEPLRPELVVEVRYDHLQGERFRHATKFVRVRPDREPVSCRYDQLEVVPPAELKAVFGRC